MRTIAVRLGMGCTLGRVHPIRLRNQEQVAGARSVEAELDCGTGPLSRTLGTQKFIASIDTSNVRQSARHVSGKPADLGSVGIVLLERVVVQIHEAATVKDEPGARAEFRCKRRADRLG